MNERSSLEVMSQLRASLHRSSGFQEPPGVVWGHRILEVAPNSPAATANLVPFLDYCLSVAGVELDGDRHSLANQMSDKEGKDVEVVVYNIKKHDTRTITLHPRRGWGGAGLLGVVARYDYFFPTTTGDAEAFDRLLSVQEVIPGSEADLTGLKAGEDFLLGSGDVSVTHCRDLVLYLWDLAPSVPALDEEGKTSVQMTVYHSPTDTVRPLVFRLSAAELVRPAVPRGAAPPAEVVFLLGAKFESGPRSMAQSAGGRFMFPASNRDTLGEMATLQSHPTLLDDHWKARMKAEGTLFDKITGASRHSEEEGEEEEGGDADE